MRNLNRALHAFGTGSALADFFGHPYNHPLADSYFSQAPVRFGDYVAKLGAVPRPRARVPCPSGGSIRIRTRMASAMPQVAFFRDHEVRFELKAQLWAMPKAQPIEDASVDWPVSISFVPHVATLRLPRQDAYAPDRVRYFER